MGAQAISRLWQRDNPAPQGFVVRFSAARGSRSSSLVAIDPHGETLAHWCGAQAQLLAAQCLGMRYGQQVVLSKREFQSVLIAATTVAMTLESIEGQLDFGLAHARSVFQCVCDCCEEGACESDIALMLQAKYTNQYELSLRDILDKLVGDGLLSVCNGIYRAEVA
ncbi:MAG: hypothetical protein AAGA84_04915 [Pseudomonadota bacterium]